MNILEIELKIKKVAKKLGLHLILGPATLIDRCNISPKFSTLPGTYICYFCYGSFICECNKVAGNTECNCL